MTFASTTMTTTTFFEVDDSPTKGEVERANTKGKNERECVCVREREREREREEERDVKPEQTNMFERVLFDEYE